MKFLKEIERPVESETGFEEFNVIEQFQVRIFVFSAIIKFAPTQTSFAHTCKAVSILKND